MKSKHCIQWLLRIAAAILFFGAIFGLLIYLGKGVVLLPPWIQWTEEDRSVQIDQETVQIRLKKRCLTFSDPDGQTLWTSGEEWKVSQVWVNDIDHDSEQEIIMLVWKIGSFGEHKPFWIEEDDDDWSQHIFIYDWDHDREDRLKPIWMSSALGIKAARVSIDENGTVTIITPEEVETRWYWESWGLLRID